MMNRAFKTCALMGLGLVLTGGCGGQSSPPSTPPAKPAAPANPPGADASAPVPPPPALVAATPAPPPPAPGQQAPSVPTASPGTDPLFYFRRDEEGRVLSDLAALQQAVEAYDRKAGLSESADEPVWPNLTNLAQLVQAGLLKALPAAPAGQKYLLDPKAAKVSLVKQ